MATQPPSTTGLWCPPKAWSPDAGTTERWLDHEGANLINEWTHWWINIKGIIGWWGLRIAGSCGTSSEGYPLSLVPSPLGLAITNHASFLHHACLSDPCSTGLTAMEPNDPQVETLETIIPSKPLPLVKLSGLTQQQNLTNTAASKFNQALGLVGKAHHPSYLRRCRQDWQFKDYLGYRFKVSLENLVRSYLKKKNLRI